jgi:tyrosinase
MANGRRTRRHFLATTAAAGSLAILSPKEVLAVLQGSTFVRQNINTLNASSPDIIALKKGIDAMKALPSTNPLNWNAWANIHGIGPTPPTGSNPLWNTCQHGHWWFLPWHRMYLLFFERIIRKLSNTPTFSLPYWDYTASTTQGNAYPARALPLIFRTPTVNNALFITQRGNSLNDVPPLSTKSMPLSAVGTATALGTPNFTSPTGSSNNFGSQQVTAPNHGASPHGNFESSPHDSVHGAIGGFMGSFGTAARDPIFWLHHCNIDRLWNVWLTMGGGRSDPKNFTWCNQLFSFFDENGRQISMRVRDVINAASQLNYRYAGEPAPVAQSCPTAAAIDSGVTVINVPQRTIAAQEQATTLGATPTTVPIRVPATSTRARMRAIASDAAKTLVLRIEGIHVDAQPGVIYEVYVGLPAGENATSTHASFVGVLSTFGAEHAGAEGHTVAFPIDKAAARALAGAGDNVSVTFVPRGSFVGEREQPVQLQGRVTFSRVRVIEE